MIIENGQKGKWGVMRQGWKIGDIVTTVSGMEIEIVNKLGEGGQGIVYLVRGMDGREYALKWYFSNKLNNPVEFCDNLENNIMEGAPSKVFLWPQEMVKNGNQFGYLMELIPSDYKALSQFLLAKERFESYEALIHAALVIVEGFRALHGKGYSYQDLNDGNFFINGKTGDVLICDNDNVAPYGENLGIKGKCRYMAPEVVTGASRPNIHTDRFSLAVILYLLLFFNHPLEGKGTMALCLTDEKEDQFYGYEPVFVWDVDNASNRPVQGLHSNQILFWNIYPQFLKDVFLEAFSKESMIGDGTGRRVTEKKWEETLIKFRDHLSYCLCGNEVFLEECEGEQICKKCGRVMSSKLALKLGKFQIPIDEGKKIYEYHTVSGSSEFGNISAEIIRNRNQSDVFGVKNLSERAFIGILPNGSAKPFKKNEVMRIVPGIKIEFESGTVGEVKEIDLS